LSGKSTNNTFILTAWVIFNALKTQDKVRWSIIYKEYPKLNKKEVLCAVEQLVDNNLLSFVDWDYVCWHRRSLKFAFQIRCDDVDADHLGVLEEVKMNYNKHLIPSK